MLRVSESREMGGVTDVVNPGIARPLLSRATVSLPGCASQLRFIRALEAGRPDYVALRVPGVLLEGNWVPR